MNTNETIRTALIPPDWAFEFHGEPVCIPCSGYDKK